MIFSYKFLQLFFNKKLPLPKKLAELLTLHSFEVEEVRRFNNDWLLDIDVTLNRAADCSSHLGIARECVAFTGLKLKTQNLKLEEDKETNIKNFIQLEVRDKSDCQRYTGRVIRGIEVKESPKYIQRYLKSCGLDTINNIVDAANYLMLEIGQPLHIFDLDKIIGSKIIVRRAKGNEKIEALNGKVYKLDENILVIADSERPMTIAGIKGGKNTAVDSKTKNIFLEAGNFNPIIIRKASKSLKLKTDASFRFGYGMDPNGTEIAIDRLAQLIQEIAGGKVAKGRADVYPRKIVSKKIKFNLAEIEKLLGIKISENKVFQILKSLGFKVAGTQVTVPTWRPDIIQNNDFAEEVGRIYGYENLKSVSPKLTLAPVQRNERIAWTQRFKDALKIAGFTEVYNHSFISKRAGDSLGYGSPESKESLVELENPFSEKFYYLRPNLLINLLFNLKDNNRYFQKRKEFRLFELGTVFSQKDKRIEEKEVATAFLVGSKDDFCILKGVVDSLLEGLGISDKFYDNYQATPENSESVFWNLKKSAEIKIGNQEVGFLGELSSKTLLKLGVKEVVTAFELDFNKLIKLCKEEWGCQPISRFPAAIRDIAILVPLETKIINVLNKINTVGGRLVCDVDLFDIYAGEGLPNSKKSLAFHIVFQDSEKTLRGEEIDNLFQKIIKTLEQNSSWEVRKEKYA